MKPLLVIPPNTARWHAVSDLYVHERAAALENIEKRFVSAAPGAQDALAVIPDGGRVLAGALISKKDATGLLAYVFTRPEHRRRGYARALAQTLVSWFEMVGGRRLYLATSRELAESLYGPLGFKPLRRLERGADANRATGSAVEGTAPQGTTDSSEETVSMVRMKAGDPDDPFTGNMVDAVVRDLTRADWPLMVELLQYRPGADPRVPLEESALSSGGMMLDLISQQDRGVCRLLGAFRGERLAGLASLAVDQLGQRTYAMQLPHADVIPSLRQAVVELGNSKGYSQVDFPLEALAETPS